MSTSTQQKSSWPEVRTGPVITGAALFGAGALIALVAENRCVPPTEQARIKWAQAKTAAAAGTAAWQNGTPARESART